MSRPTFTDRRRVQLARRVDALEAMEGRAMITESLGVLLLGIGVPAAAFGAKDAGRPAGPARTPVPRGRNVIPSPVTPRHRTRHHADGGSSNHAHRVVAPRPAPPAPPGDWLTLFRRGAGAGTAATHRGLTPAGRAAKPAAAAAGGAPRGGSGAASPGAVTPLRLPPPTPADAGSSGAVASAALGSSLAAAAPSHTAYATTAAAPAAAGSVTPAGTGGAAAPAGGTTTVLSATAAPAPAGGAASGGSPAPAKANWAHVPPHGPLHVGVDPVFALDYNDGTVLFPGSVQFATLNAAADLRAQVSGATVGSYSWDTTGLTMAAAGSVTGQNTYDLNFRWTNYNPGAPATNSVTLTVNETSGLVVTQTYSFLVPFGSVAAGTVSGGGTAPVWPESLPPDTLRPDAPGFATRHAAVDANTGALDTVIALPAYNPNLPALTLAYDSLAADPRPIVLEHHTLDPALPTPTKVTGQLTFNGTAGATSYYDTSLFNPGDVTQVALQADATALATGRYDYTVTVGDVRGPTTTSTAAGTATVVNEAANPFGAGWTLAGLERVVPAAGGVVLTLGAGRSLWFAGSFASGGGAYTSPAGEFSTLTQNADGTYTRALTDGTRLGFNAGGYETAAADRNGLTTAYGYDGANRLAAVTDPYGKATTFAYDAGGKLRTATDPAGRVATFTHSGNALTGVTLPGGPAWGYGYDAAGRMTGLTDPDAHPVTVAYDAAGRVGTVGRPDGTAESFVAYQERGWTNTGTVASPTLATQLAEARGSHTDPNGHTTDLRSDWRGMGLTDQATDPDGNVATWDRDANGLATVAVDRVNRVTLSAYDAKGNVTQVTRPDLKSDLYGTYNGFAEPASHTDPNGHTATYTYDGNGNLTAVQDALNNLTTMTYTPTGKVATVQDARGNTTSYAYDGQDRRTTVTHPDLSTNVTGYDAAGNPTAVTDERGNTTTSGYDALNRLTGTTDPLGNRTTYGYDAAGNRTAVQAPLGRTTTVAYDAMDRVASVTDPLGHATALGYDPGGNLKSVTDAVARVTTLAYDAEDRRTAVTDPLGNRTTTAYDAAGESVAVTDPLGRVTTTTYNARGWRATVTDPLNNTATYAYTATGKPSSIVSPGTSGGTTESYFYDDDDRRTAATDANNHTTTSAYDAVGNRTAVTDPNNHTTTYAYDARNRVTSVTDPLGHSTVSGNDGAGNRTTVTDPLGHATTTQYDALNRATTVTDARGGLTVTGYDAAGRNTSVVDPVGNRTTFAYDDADRLTATTDPLGHATTYGYDDADQLTDRTDRDGRRTTYAYDPAGRRVGETWVGASPAETITSAYDAAGELTGVSDAGARLTFTYDSGGRQVTAATSGPGAGQPNVTLTSGYDPFGARTGLSDNLAAAGVTTLSYDAAHRLTNLAASYGAAAGPQVAYGYDNADRLTSQSRTVGGSGTAVATGFGYDNADRLTTMTHQVAGGAALAAYAYGYDNANRLTSEQNAEGTVTYSYDDTNQLAGASGSRAEAYAYDANGNRTMTGYATGAGNRMTSGAGYTYAYDAEGNLTSKTQTAGGTAVTTFIYDHRNRLTGVTERASAGGAVTSQSTYTYDPRDQRIGVNANGTQTWTVYDGQNPYADFNGAGPVQKRYLYGPAVDALMARTDSAGNTAWYLTDKLGTIRDIATTSGTVVDHLSYDSYGRVLSESSPVNGDRFKFTGREYDPAAKLYYYRARYYDPASGRFISQDPEGFGAGDDNLYRYVGNGPMDHTDPSGLQESPVYPSPQSSPGGSGYYSNYGPPGPVSQPPLPLPNYPQPTYFQQPNSPRPSYLPPPQLFPPAAIVPSMPLQLQRTYTSPSYYQGSPVFHQSPTVTPPPPRLGMRPAMPPNAPPWPWSGTRLRVPPYIPIQPPFPVGYGNSPYGRYGGPFIPLPFGSPGSGVIIGPTLNRSPSGVGTLIIIY